MKVIDVKAEIRYRRDGDDTFFVIVEGQKPIKGRLKYWNGGLLEKSGGHTPKRRSDIKWLTDREYHGK